MATAQAPHLVSSIEHRRSKGKGGRAAFRLLSIERSDEIFAVLMEEIVALGFPRALIVAVNFDNGEIKPVTYIHCSKQFAAHFSTAMWQGENPLVRIMLSMQPGMLPKEKNGKQLYCHPLLFRNQNLCREAERSNHECLAAHNFHKPGALNLEEQICHACGMRAYASAVVVEVPPRVSVRQMSELESLIEVASSYFSRLYKVDHYYNRMRNSDVTIAQMQTLMQSMADPVILTDAQHRVIAQNRASERFFKLPDEGVTEGGARAVELNNLLFSAALSSMAVSGTSEATRDLTLVDIREGEEVLFEAVSAASFSRDGRRTGLVTVMRDVTDLRRVDLEFRSSLTRLQEAQEIVRQDRDRLNMVIENVGDPIVVADGSAKMVLLDALAQELFGRPAPASSSSPAVPISAEALNPRIVKNQVQIDSYLQAFTFSFASKQADTIHLYQPGSNTEIEYDTRSGKIYDLRGQVTHTVTVLRDHSAVRKLEQMRMERRMIEMEKFAATGRLAGTIAHEVNNPMEAIKNAIYLLGGRVTSEGEPIYGILKNETERVSRIVRQMLGLYRHSEQVSTIDVNTVIEDSLLLFIRQLEKTGVRVEKDLRKIPVIVGSPDQFRQVISNLVVNAKDSMAAVAESTAVAAGASANAAAVGVNDGGINTESMVDVNPPRPLILKIRTRHIPSPDGIHGVARIVIADTGTGIPKEMLSTVFEPFFSTKGERGTGLGLWIVRGIIQNHGGKMRIRSKVGAGTVFKIDLPVVR